MTATATQPESRPTPKRRSPIRVVPWLQGTYAIEYDAPVTINGTSNHIVTNHIPCEEPKPGLFVEPLAVFAHNVAQLVRAFAEEQAKVDGIRQENERQAGEIVELKRASERLTNQLADAKRRLEVKK